MKTYAFFTFEISVKKIAGMYLLLTKKGPMFLADTTVNFHPTAEELEDIEFGFQVAKEIGRLDIGQTVVVKNKAVMAVEAIEGTDACILRGGTLGKGVVVAKTAKPAQDNRFDMPSVGVRTIESMIAAGAAGIVLEAGRTLLVERQRTLALADEHNMFVVAR